MLSPVKSTIIDAARAGYLRGWPGLTAAAISKHIKVVEATEMGHMNQRRQNLGSTKKTYADAAKHLAIQESINPMEVPTQ